jgi:nitroreductase
MISAIYNRRSIRKFIDKPISKKDIIDIIQSGIKAPSSKNRQPWKNIVIQGNTKEEMLKVFRQGIEREENDSALLPDSKQHLTAAKYTADIMAEAPTIIFVVNSLGKSILSELTPEERVFEICNIQSIGASIQNMLLAATEKGIGSLWICDIYFAYLELCKWLNSDGQLIAAIAFGYPNEFPKERPRKKLDDIVEWKSGMLLPD